MEAQGIGIAPTSPFWYNSLGPGEWTVLGLDRFRDLIRRSKYASRGLLEMSIFEEILDMVNSLIVYLNQCNVDTEMTSLKHFGRKPLRSRLPPSFP